MASSRGHCFRLRQPGQIELYDLSLVAGFQTSGASGFGTQGYCTNACQPRQHQVLNPRWASDCGRALSPRRALDRSARARGCFGKHFSPE